jgi:hypothetical protein
MSQAGIINTSAGPVPPAVPTSFITDVNSPSVPIANIENVKGGTSTSNNSNGVQTDGSSGSNTLTVQLTNRAAGSTTTAGAVTSSAITLALGATPGVYTFDIAVAGFNASTPAGCGFTIVGSVRTTGASATLITNQAVDHFEEAALITATAVLAVSGNNALVNVTGVAGLNIDWQVTLTYTFAS